MGDVLRAFKDSLRHTSILLDQIAHGADLSSDKFEVEGWVLPGALECGKRLTKVSTEASILDWNNGGML
jgi:hypothetical protein